MIKLKSFILAKEYPNSPKLGTKLIESRTTSGKTIGYFDAHTSYYVHNKVYPPTEIENFPDFWERQS